MADWGLQVFNDAGSVVWDSTKVAGGVIATIATYAATQTGVLTFPQFASRSVQIVPDRIWFFGADATVVADTALGYPRVTVTASTASRRFMVVVY